MNQDGDEAELTDGGLTTAVCEVTDLVDLAGWPEGTRLIIRRQPTHPGAQTCLLPDLEYLWSQRSAISLRRLGTILI